MYPYFSVIDPGFVLKQCALSPLAPASPSLLPHRTPNNCKKHFKFRDAAVRDAFHPNFYRKRIYFMTASNLPIFMVFSKQRS